MKRLSLLIAAAVLMAGSVLWQQGALERLRLANARLKSPADVGRASKSLTDAPEMVSGANGDQTLSATEHLELLRLRNQVRMLRNQPAPIEQLQVENAKLAAELANGTIRPRRLAEAPDFVAREKWAKVGRSTPEDALQTFFAALESADVAELSRGLATASGSPDSTKPPSDPLAVAKELQRGYKQLPQVSGYRISYREERAPGTVVLGLQFAADGLNTEMILVQDSSGWRLTDYFREPTLDAK